MEGLTTSLRRASSSLVHRLLRAHTIRPSIRAHTLGSPSVSWHHPQDDFTPSSSSTHSTGWVPPNDGDLRLFSYPKLVHARPQRGQCCCAAARWHSTSTQELGPTMLYLRNQKNGAEVCNFIMVMLEDTISMCWIPNVRVYLLSPWTGFPCWHSTRISKERGGGS